MQVENSSNSCCSDHDPASNNSVHRELFIIQGDSPVHVHEPFYDYIMAIHLEPAAIQPGLAATALDLVESLCSPIEETSYDDTRSELVVGSMQLLIKRFIRRSQAKDFAVKQRTG